MVPDWKTVHHKKTKPKKVVGADTGSTTLRSASMNNKIRRAVFHVDNIVNDTTESDVVSFLQSKDIEVLTCYPAKSWMKSTTCCVAVRLCVKAKDKGRVLDPKLWPAGVVIRQWKFAAPHNHNE